MRRDSFRVLRRSQEQHDKGAVMRNIVSVDLQINRKSRAATASALEAVAEAIRKGDVATIPARFTFGLGLNLSVTEHDLESEDVSAVKRRITS